MIVCKYKKKNGLNYKILTSFANSPIYQQARKIILHIVCLEVH